jgi:hypothetical protein
MLPGFPLSLTMREVFRLHILGKGRILSCAAQTQLAGCMLPVGRPVITSVIYFTAHCTVITNVHLSAVFRGSSLFCRD